MARHLPHARLHARRVARLGAVLALSAAVVVSVAALPAAAGTIHVVQRGESLASIAARGKLDSWRPIWDANAGLTDPNLIYPGQRLAVPAKGEKVEHRPLPAGFGVVAQPAAVARPSTVRTEPARVRPARVRSSVAGRVRSSVAGGTVWDRLARCESGGNWSTSTGNGFYGGLQFSASTWRAAGGTGSASQASRSEQIRVAQRVLARQGWGAWPACSSQLGLR